MKMKQTVLALMIASITVLSMTAAAFASEDTSPINAFGINAVEGTEDAAAADGFETAEESKEAAEDAETLPSVVIMSQKPEEEGGDRFVTICIIDKENKQLRTATVDSGMIVLPEDMEEETYEAIIDAMNESWGIGLSSYLAIDMEKTMNMIDNMEGIELEVTEDEASILQEKFEGTFEAGTCLLDGEQALSIMSNASRARDILGAMFVKSADLDLNGKLLFGFGLLAAASANISTDDVVALANVPLAGYDIYEAVFPDYAFASDFDQQENGEFVVNMEQTEKRLLDFINNAQEPEEAEEAAEEISEE